MFPRLEDKKANIDLNSACDAGAEISRVNCAVISLIQFETESSTCVRTVINRCDKWKSTRWGSCQKLVSFVNETSRSTDALFQAAYFEIFYDRKRRDWARCECYSKGNSSRTLKDSRRLCLLTRNLEPIWNASASLVTNSPERFY